MRFGEYLRQKRLEKNMKAKIFAEALDISPAYLSSLENESRQPPSYELLERIAENLDLRNNDRYQIFDLAASNKQPPEISRDLVEYIYKNPQIIEILRYAMKCSLTEREWSTIAKFVYRAYKY